MRDRWVGQLLMFHGAPGARERGDHLGDRPQRESVCGERHLLHRVGTDPDHQSAAVPDHAREFDAGGIEIRYEIDGVDRDSGIETVVRQRQRGRGALGDTRTHSTQDPCPPLPAPNSYGLMTRSGALASGTDLASAILVGDNVIGLVPDWSGNVWFATGNGLLGMVTPAGAVATAANILARHGLRCRIHGCTRPSVHPTWASACRGGQVEFGWRGAFSGIGVPVDGSPATPLAHGRVSLSRGGAFHRACACLCYPCW